MMRNSGKSEFRCNPSSSPNLFLRNGWMPGSSPWSSPRMTHPMDALPLQQAGLVEIHRQDRQLEEGRARVALVEEQHTDIFVAHVDFRGIVLARPRHHADALVVELALEIGIELLEVRALAGPL